MKPTIAFKRFARLVGDWELRGRTLNSKYDNVSGRVKIEMLPGGFLMAQHGEIKVKRLKLSSLEIVRYDPSTRTFPAYVFSDRGGTPLNYCWDIRGKIVKHWTKGWKYTGKFSKDGNVLSGGWRPEEGKSESAYDATMIRKKGSVRRKNP
ncbi:MAG TPA: hypothetical protein VJN71_02880 [Nitrososphaerales archaeon]|nr:hypothetical protein [Nitrososphaerales archaeon]